MPTYVLSLCCYGYQLPFRPAQLRLNIQAMRLELSSLGVHYDFLMDSLQPIRMENSPEPG